MVQNSRRSARWLDGTAVALSTLCVLHCLTLPLLVAGLPLLAEYTTEHFHVQMLVIVLPLSILALAFGYRRHSNGRVVAAGSAGMLLLFIGATLAHSILGLAADRLFTISGALILAAAHFYNSLFARRCHVASANG